MISSLVLCILYFFAYKNHNSIPFNDFPTGIKTEKGNELE